MRYLIVTAHPSTRGFTHRMANAFADEVRSAGHHVDIIDLYAPENALPYLTFEDVREVVATPERDRFQKMIIDANEVIFMHPIWWGGPPAIMKNWLDNVLSSGFAFRYTKKGPEGLLPGKVGRVFCTGGTPFWLYCCILFPFFIVWGLFVIGFCGLRVGNLTYFHNKPHQPEEDRERYLQKVRRIARKSARKS